MERQLIFPIEIQNLPVCCSHPLVAMDGSL
jgi:hypothetical protein